MRTFSILRTLTFFAIYIHTFPNLLFTLNLIWLYILKLKHDSNSVILYFKIHFFIDLNEKNYNIETKQATSFIYLLLMSLYCIGLLDWVFPLFIDQPAFSLALEFCRLFLYVYETRKVTERMFMRQQCCKEAVGIPWADGGDHSLPRLLSSSDVRD